MNSKEIFEELSQLCYSNQSLGQEITGWVCNIADHLLKLELYLEFDRNSKKHSGDIYGWINQILSRYKRDKTANNLNRIQVYTLDSIKISLKVRQFNKLLKDDYKIRERITDVDYRSALYTSFDLIKKVESESLSKSDFINYLINFYKR